MLSDLPLQGCTWDSEQELRNFRKTGSSGY